MTKKNHRAEKTAEILEINEADPSLCSLPQELLLSILEKNTDLNSLFQCALVSKYFTSVVSDVQAVSFTIPSSGDVSHESWIKLLALVAKVHLPSSEQVLAIREFLSSQNLNLPTFLENFQNVKSVHLEYISSEKYGIPNLLSPKWKVKFNDSGKVESFAALLAGSVRKVTEEDPNPQMPFPELLVRNRSRERFWVPYMRYVEWMCLTYLLVKDHASLEHVTIIDSEKHSKLVTRGKELLKFRTSVPLELLKKPAAGKIIKLIRVPVLHLPLSGYVMSWAVLQLIISDEDGNLQEIVSKFIEDDNSVLCEALKEIFTNHAYQVRTLPKSCLHRW